MIDASIVLSVIYNSGVVSQDELKKLEPFCQAICEEISRRLKSEDYANAYAVIMACAGVAFYTFLLANSTTEDFSSFKAGDVTVTQNREARIENAAKYKNEVLVLAAPYLTDVDFSFKAVEV